MNKLSILFFFIFSSQIFASQSSEKSGDIDPIVKCLPGKCVNIQGRNNYSNEVEIVLYYNATDKKLVTVKPDEPFLLDIPFPTWGKIVVYDLVNRKDHCSGISMPQDPNFNVHIVDPLNCKLVKSEKNSNLTPHLVAINNTNDIQSLIIRRAATPGQQWVMRFRPGATINITWNDMPSVGEGDRVLLGSGNGNMMLLPIKCNFGASCAQHKLLMAQRKNNTNAYEFKSKTFSKEQVFNRQNHID